MASHITFLATGITDADARLADYPSASPLVSGRKSAPLQAREDSPSNGRDALRQDREVRTILG